MTVGPLQLVLITFPHDRFDAEVLPELGALRTYGSVRIVDMVLVRKDVGGNVAEPTPDDMPGARPGDGVLVGLLSAAGGGGEELLELMAELPAPGTGALVLLEHRWATHLRAAVRRVGGDLVAGGLVRSPELRDAVQRREGTPASKAG